MHWYEVSSEQLDKLDAALLYALKQAREAVERAPTQRARDVFRHDLEVAEAALHAIGDVRRGRKDEGWGDD